MTNDNLFNAGFTYDDIDVYIESGTCALYIWYFFYHCTVLRKEMIKTVRSKENFEN